MRNKKSSALLSRVAHQQLKTLGQLFKNLGVEIKIVGEQ
jgi:hypothetical protein